jgi:hypothetical protein
VASASMPNPSDVQGAQQVGRHEVEQVSRSAM